MNVHRSTEKCGWRTANCALGVLAHAIGYASGRNFLPNGDTTHAVAQVTGAMRTWWLAYARSYPDGDWQPVARVVLRDHGYPITDDLRATPGREYWSRRLAEN
jgi:hypothetical protein